MTQIVSYVKFGKFHSQKNMFRKFFGGSVVVSAASPDFNDFSKMRKIHFNVICFVSSYEIFPLIRRMMLS